MVCLFAVNPRLALALFALCPTGVFAQEAVPVKLTASSDRVRVEIGRKLFTEYVFSGARRPYLYPILASDSTELNREYPMTSPAGEDHDHPHHRSLWFAHSSVNGVDFWNEGAGGAPKGQIVHDKLLQVQSGAVGEIRATDRWVCPDGTIACTDETTIRFLGDATTRTIDYTVTLKAPEAKPVLIGDDKDGTMAIRLAQWMTMTHDYQKHSEPGVGHILTSTGIADAQAWGKRADWCDYYAQKDGKTYGVAIFDSTANLRHPTWWMARDYGLFGANPFGQHAYEDLKDQPHAGDYTIPAGRSLTLSYRFIVHLGTPEEAGIAGLYKAYAGGR